MIKVSRFGGKIKSLSNPPRIKFNSVKVSGKVKLELNFIPITNFVTPSGITTSSSNLSSMIKTPSEL